MQAAIDLSFQEHPKGCFFIKVPHMILVTDAQRDYNKSVVFFYNSKNESLCKPTKIITDFKNKVCKTQISLPYTYRRVFSLNLEN